MTSLDTHTHRQLIFIYIDKWISERAILAPKNIDVHEINNIVLTKIRDQASPLQVSRHSFGTK